MGGTFSENKSGFVIVNEVEHGGNDTATLRSFRPLLKIFVWPVPLSRGDAVPEDILSCRGSVLLCFFIIGSSGRSFLEDCFKKALFFIDFIDEKRPYQAFTGIVLWEIPENDFFLIFSFTALYFHMGNSISFCTHSERRGCINTRSRTGYSRILPKQLLPHHLH